MAIDRGGKLLAGEQDDDEKEFSGLLEED